MRLGCAYLAAAVVFLSSAIHAYGVKIALTAVKKNNTPIAQTNEIFAAPGDTIECEILISDWGDELPDGIRLYSAQIEIRRGAQSGTNGFVLPKGWDAPVDFTGQCSTDWECSSNLTFSCMNGLCRGPNHQPWVGCFINQSHPQFIFLGETPLADVGTNALDYTYYATLLDGGRLDPGHPVYAGTLVLVVGESACGSFRFTLDDCAGTTWIESPSFVAPVPELVALVIQLPECPAVLIASDPPDCQIDARMPHLPGQPLELLTTDSIIFSFDKSPAGLTTESFRTRLVLPGPAPNVLALQSLPENDLRVELDRAISTGSWNCVEHRASGRESCLASLPGDVNGDGLVDLLDVRESPGAAPDDLIEWLRPLVQQQLPRCDLDRSGKCTPLDLWTMMNGLIGSGFSAWMGAELPSLCPSKSSDFRVARGSCCNALNGDCVDDVREENCQFSHQRWAPNTSCCEAPCSAPTGACCELATGVCTNAVFQVNCQGIEQEWTASASCSSLNCEASRGACCNLDTGQCGNNVLESACETQSSAIWFPGRACNEILCSPQ